MMRATAIALARAANALYFLASALYCLLSYSSFAYAQFIRPQLVGWLPDWVAIHHQLYWLTLVVTLPTLLPAMRKGAPARARIAASIYVAAAVALGLWLTVSPVLANAQPNPRTLVLAVLCLVPPFALAIVDHVIAGRMALQRIDQSRLFVTVTAAALVSWLSYVVLIPWYVPRTVGLDLTPPAIALAAAIALATHLVTFAVIYLVAAAAFAVASLTRSAVADYWVLAALWVAGCALVLQRVVADALSFRTAESLVLSLWVSVVLVAIWSGIARQYPGNDGDAIDAWFRPVAPRLAVAVGGLLGLPLLALGLRAVAVEFDWNFLLQKLGATVVWAVALAWTSLAIPNLLPRVVTMRGRTCDVIAVVMVLVGLAAVPMATRVAAWRGDATLAPEFVVDRYAALDASYQLLRSLTRTNAGADAEFYEFLKAHSTLGFVSAKPVDVNFVERFQSTSTLPHVFLFIIDSLRRDYVSSYNPAVTFTPSLQAFGAESIVFERAFTRYGATGLSVPALWTGGMMLHKQYVLPFAPMHSLEKLLDAAGYRRFMSDDHLVEQLFKRSADTTLLDETINEMDHTVCSTVNELQSKMDATTADPRPIFAMTRPLQLHVARLVRDRPTPASAFPGFAAGYAAQVAALDRCFGQFVDYLKKKDLYDNSVVILTSDHGESLGEDGRFGHAYTLDPEVVRIPLIIHLPKNQRQQLVADPSRVALSTDITPTLYMLAGQQPRDLGKLYGTPLFFAAGTPPPPRRRDAFLMASSYGPVYAMLRRNGRSLYIANAIDGVDIAYEMRPDGRMERLTMTDVLRTANRALIREHIGLIADEYDFSPAR